MKHLGILLVGALLGVSLMLFIGASKKFQIGSGGDLWTAEETVSATANFSTSPVFMGGSQQILMGLDFTTMAASKCDCTIYSGNTRVVADGFASECTFAPVTGVEKVVKACGQFFPYVWATCGLTGASTIVVGVTTAGKP